MMDYDDVWFRNQVTKLSRDLADLKATVDFQKRVLEMHASHIAELRQANKAVIGTPRVPLLEEAAGEIERLKKEVAWHEKENDRLREALRRIEDFCAEDGIPHGIRSFRAMQKARSALGKVDE